MKEGKGRIKTVCSESLYSNCITEILELELVITVLNNR